MKVKLISNKSHQKYLTKDVLKKVSKNVYDKLRSKSRSKTQEHFDDTKTIPLQSSPPKESTILVKYNKLSRKRGGNGSGITF